MKIPKDMRNLSPDIEQPLKICYMIATLGHGRGGHFSSLKVTAEAVSQTCDCFIMDVGVRPSPVLSKSFIRSYHIPFDGRNVMSAFRGIFRITKDERPNVLHLFDGRVDFFARLLSAGFRLPLVRTKCGGAPPRKFYPYYDNLILYSEEDLSWFMKCQKFAHANIHLIPQRSASFVCDDRRIADLRSHLPDSMPVFLRVSRFCQHYEESMLQSVRLVKRLNMCKKRCQLIIVGFAQNPKVYEHIRSFCGDDVHVFSDDRFTLDAHQLIGVADFVIGTGRGFMEAANCGKVLLTPSSEKELPFLVTEDNFRCFFATNFSPRNVICDYDEATNYCQIEKALEDINYRRALQALARRLNAEFFDIAGSLERYGVLYRDIEYRRGFSCLDLALGFRCLKRSFAEASAS